MIKKIFFAVVALVLLIFLALTFVDVPIKQVVEEKNVTALAHKEGI
tara:strand:- start:54 stop:191 length:138 start_codon:yes stop_codon:yes gene_type:complete